VCSSDPVGGSQGELTQGELTPPIPLSTPPPLLHHSVAPSLPSGDERGDGKSRSFHRRGARPDAPVGPFQWLGVRCSSQGGRSQAGVVAAQGCLGVRGGSSLAAGLMLLAGSVRPGWIRGSAFACSQVGKRRVHQRASGDLSKRRQHKVGILGLFRLCWARGRQTPRWSRRKSLLFDMTWVRRLSSV